MWNGIGWYGFIGPTRSTTDISLWYPRNTNTRVVTLKTYAFDYEIIQSQITDPHTAPR